MRLAKFIIGSLFAATLTGCEAARTVALAPALPFALIAMNEGGKSKPLTEEAYYSDIDPAAQRFLGMEEVQLRAIFGSPTSRPPGSVEYANVTCRLGFQIPRRPSGKYRVYSAYAHGPDGLGRFPMDTCIRSFGG